ncbi:MAG TPA: ribbon-helix-helix domain-containing protein [Verrucomicrobiae bacterium]|nr:ribbon-helix-helix domain-containing protein [Verrucomicrobiae bacterium]
MKRGSLKKAESTLVNFYAPDPLLVQVEEAVVELDTDRSKFIRTAIREKLNKHGIKIPKEAAA